ncbi:MAG: heterodisulfide reductase-related iron-sulfur binding cluster [Cycloclasticus sp.]
MPKNQRCCSAIDLHAGKKSHYLELAQQNDAVFSGNSYDAIITLASGCGSTLAEYDHPLSDNISDFIAPFLAKTIL